jgi:beta-mannosidase
MFMDCWPSITWSVLSYARVPKQGYPTLQQVYQPVLVGAEIHRKKVLLGRDLGSHDRPFQLACWLVNDRHAVLEGCQLTVALRRGDATPVAVVRALPPIAADSVATMGVVTLDLPAELLLGKYELELALQHQDSVISRNAYSVEIVGLGDWKTGDWRLVGQ